MLPDAFDANTEHSANPLYDILPRSAERVGKGECVAPAQFQQLWTGAPPCCPLRGWKYCPRTQGLPARGIRTCAVTPPSRRSVPLISLIAPHRTEAQ